ncbi:MAG: MBL fold metallo-hydrolase, partial [Candidatus Altiarchaeota archaeon]|nr:MBL fold metallo-hydrolase [Candidatus Altiarchaeota archaeon]
DRGGKVILPVFAVGRAQEMLLLLKDIGHQVYLDGMAQTATQIILQNPGYVKDYDDLEQAARDAVWVKSRRHRKEILDEAGVILTTAGMLEGGPVIQYISKLYKDANSSIILTGYQVEGTNGRRLVEEGYIIDDATKKKYRVSMNISKFDFSAHADQKGLADLVKKMTPEVVFLIHGEFDSCEALRHEIGGDCKIHIPYLGEKITV